MLCAGITTYSPLKHWNVGPGKKVGVVGLGGLEHMGLKFSHAFGAHTVMFTTSANKVEDGKRLGADDVVLTKEQDWHAPHAGTFDFILDCVSAELDLSPYLALVVSDIEMTTYDKLENAWSRVIKSDVKYRLVLDAKSLQKQSSSREDSR